MNLFLKTEYRPKRIQFFYFGEGFFTDKLTADNVWMCGGMMVFLKMCVREL